MFQTRRSGFLLLEALVSLALLAMGLGVCLESFACVQAAMKRDDRRWKLAPCAEEKLLEFSLAAPVPASDCSSDVAWNTAVSPFPGHLERLVLTATWRDGERMEEETFESIRTAN